MRAGTAFLLTLLLLCGAAVAVDAWVTATAEEQGSQRVGAALGAPTEVELAGWPVSLRLLQGRVPTVRLLARDVGLDGGVTLDLLQVEVSDVRITFAELRGAGDLPVSGGSGTFRAELSEAAVGELLGRPGAVQLGAGIGRLDLDGQVVEAVAGVEAGNVVLRPVSPATGDIPPVTLVLPPLPGTAVVDDVRLEPGVLELRGRVLRLTR